MFQRILVPVDGSETSNKAMVAALNLARLTGGRLRIVHAFDDIVYISGYEYDAQARYAAREEAAKVLETAKAVALAAGIGAETCLLETRGRRLGEAIADEAQAWDAELVVVGTHGRRGVGRVLLGSGAEQIIRTSPVPVLTIRNHD